MDSFTVILVVLIYDICGIFSANVVKNYCDVNLCGTARNTACNNTGQFKSSCPAGIKLFTFTSAQKQLMVDTINSYRSNLALGASSNASGDNFPMASQMNKLQWDVEQEFMSSLQIKTCASHDPCKNTWYNTSFFNIPMFAGQNIYYESTYAPQRPPLDSTITNSVFAWYNEIIVAPTSEADYVAAVPGREIGHFLTISHDQTQRVGCTGSQYEKLDLNGINRFTQITCNFDKAPFLTLPLYKKGEPCAGCPDTCDLESDAPGLCVVDPKSFKNTYYF